jgi:hypothetical protein
MRAATGWIRRHITRTGLIAFIVVIATSATAWAALVGSAQVANGSLRSIDIKNGSLTGIDIRNGTVRGIDIASRTVGPTDLAPLPFVLVGFNASNAVADSGGGYSTIMFDKEIADRSNVYNAATGLVTAPRPGIYHLEANVLLSNDTPPGVARMFVYVNDDAVAGAFNDMNAGQPEASVAISTEVVAATGDTFKVGFGQDSGGADSMLAGYTTFSVRWVGPAS